MISWACDDSVNVLFDSEPIVQVRVIKPEMTKLQKKSIKKYPFCNKKKFKVKIVDFDNIFTLTYEFEIKENYCFDGASIPRFFWRLIGAPTNNEFLIAALVHDVLCENHQYISYNRNLSSKVFRALLLASGVGKIKANIMYLAVDNYQKLCGWGKDDNKNKKVS